MSDKCGCSCKVDVVLFVVCLFVIALAVCVIAILPVNSIVQMFFPDDAFFYIKTACNISQGLGSTFDGINVTNGYHPLYMIILSIVSRLIPLTGTQGIYAVMVVDTLLLLFGIVMVNAFVNKLAFSNYQRAFTLLAIVGAVGLNDFGMEARLLVPVAWLFVCLMTRLSDSSNSYLAIIQVALVGVFVFLTRVDSAILVGSIAFAYWAFCMKFESKNLVSISIKAALLLVPSFLAGLSFLMFNYIVYGHTSMISSHLKVGWPGFFFANANPFTHLSLGLLVRLFFCLTIAVIYLYYFISSVLRKQIPDSDKDKFLSATMLAGVNLYNVIYLLTLMALGNVVASWYFALPLSISIVTMVYLLRLAPVRIVRTGERLMLICSIIGLVFFIVQKLPPASISDRMRISIWIKENLPENARIFQVDSSGGVGYFSERAVVNGDGLINGWEFQEFLERYALPAYLVKHKINYLLWTKYSGKGSVRVRVPRWNAQHEVLTFREEPEQIVRFGRFLLLKPEMKLAEVSPLLTKE